MKFWESSIIKSLGWKEEPKGIAKVMSICMLVAIVCIFFLPANLGRALDELESDRKYLNPIFSNEVLDKIIDLERRDHREIAIRPHPHEFYLYFDV